jgi:Leucine-rich repeat (LRR) protein
VLRPLPWSPSAPRLQIKVLDDSIGTLTALHTLDLANNDIGELCPALGFLPKLTRIAVDGTHVYYASRWMCAPA